MTCRTAPWLQRAAFSRAVLTALALAVSCLRVAAGDAGVDFFETRIRPLLVENCYKCHSAESERVKGGLLLDSREGLAKGGESGPAIIAGDPDASLLVKAVRRTDEKLQMPPKKALAVAQVADLVQWVRMGAPDPRVSAPARSPLLAKAAAHWAFQPPQSPPVPAVKNSAWPQNAIDFFVLAKLEEKGLEPASEADRRTLLRRASFDVTGLPPSYEEVRAFEKDSSPDAYERAVNRLLDSPRYGERWGRHWLDVARFADTKGYVYSDREEGQFVHSHVYRDWVIRAFNLDMPYDEFLREQIAGDQLPAAEGLASPLAATGFLTVGRRFLGVTHDIIDDRIDTLSKATQALTVSCARCHDHKFDPIPTEDYYSLYGVFAASTERTVCLEKNPAQTAEYLEFKKGYDERVKKLNDTFEKRKEELLARVRTKTPEYLGAVLQADQLPTEEHYEIRGPDDLNPTIVRRWQSYLEQTGKSFHPVWAPWHRFAKVPADRFTERAKEEWAELEKSSELNAVVKRAFAAAPPESMKEVAAVFGKLLAAANQKRAEGSELSAPERDLVQVLYGPESPVNVPPGSVWDVEWFFHEAVRVEFGKLQSEIDRWIIKSPGAPRFAVTLEDKPAARNPRVFRRGNPANRGEEVPRRYLAVIEGKDRKPFQKGSGRLEMANAIASRDNPLTARVFVNRVWAGHFGEGLVKTLNDFGTRSEPPSHPELLDWLANYFVDNGWSVKKLHRLILLSSTYRQSSVVENRAGEAADPANRLLWRMNPHRLEFEELRDSLLLASGELSTEAGGKARPLFGSNFLPKRSVYGFIDRQFLPGVYRVFDFPNPDLPSGQRSLTTVPQQALYLMNSPFLVERARRVARGSEQNGTHSPEERVRLLYERAFQRDPSREEIQSGLEFIRQAGALPSPEPPPPPPPSAWSYGYGRIENEKVQFSPLPLYADGAWQGGTGYPDAKLGWAKLTAEGGHAGNDLQHAVIRRWNAPVSGRISISGTLEHKHAEGDGIHASLVSSRHGIIGQWTLHNAKAKTDFERIAVEKEDTIDFVVDVRAGLNNDDFVWAPIIQFAGQESKGMKTEWDAKKEFSGPPETRPEPLKPWESLAQTLLMANEFIFVD